MMGTLETDLNYKLRSLFQYYISDKTLKYTQPTTTQHDEYPLHAVHEGSHNSSHHTNFSGNHSKLKQGRNLEMKHCI